MTIKRRFVPAGVTKVPEPVFDSYLTTAKEQVRRWWNAYYDDVVYARGPDGWYIAQDPLRKQ